MLIDDEICGKSLHSTRQRSYTIYKGGSICKVDTVNLCQFSVTTQIHYQMERAQQKKNVEAQSNYNLSFEINIKENVKN